MPTTEPTHTIRVPSPRGRHGGSRGGKGWAKTVTGIDRSQPGGYAILGNFARGTIGAHAGQLIIAVGEDRSSRGRLTGHYVDLYQVTPTGELTRIYDAETGSLGEWVPGALDAIEAAMQPAVKLTDDEQELARALAELPAERFIAVIKAAGTQAS